MLYGVVIGGQRGNVCSIFWLFGGNGKKKGGTKMKENQ